MPGHGAATPDHEDLLARREWIRALARTLATDGASADDLEQETLAVALRSPPPGGGLPPAWLATVLRNLSRRTRRDATRVRRREEAAARREAAPDPADVVARAEIHRRVVDAVLALPEPARTAILLRFYDGLPPREVAARTGVPVETARSRVKRALEDLRRRLGGERGREALLLALAPLLRPAGKAGVAAGAAGGIAMGAAAKIGIGAGLVVLAAGGVVAWRTGAPGTAPPPPPPPAGSAPSPPPDPAPPIPAPSPVPADAPSPAGAPDSGAVPGKRTVDEILATVVTPFGIDEPTSLSRALEALAKPAGLSVDYDTGEIRTFCETHEVPPMKLKGGLSLRTGLAVLLKAVPSPGPRPLGYQVRDDRLLLLLVDPPPPPRPDPAAVEKQGKAEEALMEKLRTTRTSFRFEGQTLPDALAYLSARHGMNFLGDEGARARLDRIKVTLTVDDRPLAEALDELVRPHPDLKWEVRGEVVLILGK
jgi:RNA polymerase sigma factor (sigma-70 family)